MEAFRNADGSCAAKTVQAEDDAGGLKYGFPINLQSWSFKLTGLRDESIRIESKIC